MKKPTQEQLTNFRENHSIYRKEPQITNYTKVDVSLEKPEGVELNLIPDREHQSYKSATESKNLVKYAIGQNDLDTYLEDEDYKFNSTEEVLDYIATNF